MKEVKQQVVERRQGVINAVEEFKNRLLEPDPHSVVMGIDISKREYECTIYVPELVAEANHARYYKATYEHSVAGLDALASTLKKI
ncbi:hypothetical protein QUF58_14410 [Anaerolineales bacterium HSG24]|nr:hypothetical protein [Anaerolineales bacterium HSG24]